MAYLARGTSTGISFHRETVEVLSGVAGTDRYGNGAANWTTPDVAVIGGCRLVPVLGAEVLDRLTRRWTLYAPIGTALTSANRIRWREAVYDVTGEVRRWESPSGRLAHLEADLERVEG